MPTAAILKLGLIGDNIAGSRSPKLHRLAGAQHGREVRYDRLVPSEMGMSMAQVFDHCQRSGYRGINVTYAYKEKVTVLLRINAPHERSIGAVNTVLFEADGPVGHNTDYSGFIASYRSARRYMATGPVLLIGAGGVGRAIAFALIALGTKDIRLVDHDKDKAQTLSQALRLLAPDLKVTVLENAQEAAQGASGLINCTPVGMTGLEGTPLPRVAMTQAAWAFDAVYTPAKTQFLTDANAANLDVISGWELFFHQGMQAWSLFTKLPLDAVELRRDLDGPKQPRSAPSPNDESQQT